VLGDAVAGIDRHAEGIRIRLEHRDLAGSEVVDVLLVVRRRDREQRLLIGERIHERLAGDVKPAGIVVNGCQAGIVPSALPPRSAPSGVSSSPPSRAACSGEIAAASGWARSVSSAAAVAAAVAEVRV
jgi:hypothetical protein